MCSRYPKSSVRLVSCWYFKIPAVTFFALLSPMLFDLWVRASEVISEKQLSTHTSKLVLLPEIKLETIELQALRDSCNHFLGTNLADIVVPVGASRESEEQLFTYALKLFSLL